MEERRIYQRHNGEPAIPIVSGSESLAVSVAAPIISSGDALGLVLFISDNGQTSGVTEYKLAQTIAAFLGKHMEA